MFYAAELSTVSCEYETDDPPETCDVETTFTFKVSAEEYHRIAPQPNYNRLWQPWCDIFYREFHQRNKQCALVFTYNQCQKHNSRKRGNFWSGKACCRADRLHCVKVWFTIVDEPQPRQDVEVIVKVRGLCTHGTDDDTNQLQPQQPNRRFVENDERSKVAQLLRQSLETPASLHEKRLAEMEPEEVNAGNTTSAKRHSDRRCMKVKSKNVCTTTLSLNSTWYAKRGRRHCLVPEELMALFTAWDCTRSIQSCTQKHKFGRMSRCAEVATAWCIWTVPGPL